jgi:hypothetical protein
MAEIKVAIKADDSDIKAKFRESSAAAAEFASQVKKEFAGLKDVGSEMAGKFGSIKDILGGLSVAGIAGTLAEGFKKAVGSAISFEDSITHLKAILPPGEAGLAPGLAAWLQSISGALGTTGENLRAFDALVATRRPGESLENLKTTFLDIQNASGVLGEHVDELAAKFGELRQGEMPRGLQREIPQLWNMALSRFGENPTPQQLLSMLPSIAPGQMNAPIRQALESTTSGRFKDISQELENSFRTLGTEILPGVNSALKDLKDQMPALTKAFKGVGENLAHVEDSFNRNKGWLSGLSQFMSKEMYGVSPLPHMLGLPAPPGAFDLWGMISRDADELLKKLHLVADKQGDAADKTQRALNPH